MKVDVEFIKFVVAPLGISHQLFMTKIENDIMLPIFMDNINLFLSSNVYENLLIWIKQYFEPVFVMDPSRWEAIKQKDKYLVSLIYLVIPTLHMRFFHRSVDSVTPHQILKEFFDELGIAVDLSRIKNKETEFVW